MQLSTIKQILPDTLIESIGSYLYPKKKQFKDIIRQVQTIMKAQKYNEEEWKSIIGQLESVEVTIASDTHYTYYNFSSFLYFFIINKIIPQIMEQVKNFCFAVITKNPLIIKNSYQIQIKYCHYFPYPSFELLATYLIHRTLDRQLMNQSYEKQEVIFNILQFMLNNKFVASQYNHYLVNALRKGPYLGRKIVETVELILNYFEAVDQNYIIQNMDIHEQQMRGSQFFQQFYKNLLRKYYQPQKQFLKTNFTKTQVQNNQQQLIKEFQHRRKRIKKVIQLFGFKPSKFIYQHEKQIQRCILGSDRLIQMFSWLIQFDNYRRIIWSESSIFSIFNSRCQQIIKLVWCQQKRREIAKMKYQGENLLESVSNSYGLTHNTIILLWQSGLFLKMPSIKNSRSKKIIQKRYSV